MIDQINNDTALNTKERREVLQVGSRQETASEDVQMTGQKVEIQVSSAWGGGVM